MAGIIHDRTKGIDRTLKQLAIDFKRSDIKSTRQGEAQPGIAKSNSGVIWADPKSIGNVKIAPPVHGERVGVSPRQVGNFSGPRIGSYIADHENLKLKR
ncbi:MAG: hypothetical protein KGJ13_09490 [Patescibacteria group bacterium]|nr:hypothetical protein [Patescibacteria group bacterium]